jgi:hypothetical protein
VPQTLTPGQPIVFQQGNGNLGAGVTTAGTAFNSFMIQQGAYQMEFSGFGFAQPSNQTPLSGLQMSIGLVSTPQATGPIWSGVEDTAGLLDVTPATKLVNISGGNTVIQFIFNGAANASQQVSSIGIGVGASCNLVITRVNSAGWDLQLNNKF